MPGCQQAWRYQGHAGVWCAWHMLEEPVRLLSPAEAAEARRRGAVYDQDAAP
jgi:hypothetical protein